jgi:hypothetical protein
MPGSDSEDDIDDGEFDNEGEEDIEQEIFDAIEAGVEEATEGDPVCCSCSNGSCGGQGIADCLAIGISRGGLRRRGR